MLKWEGGRSTSLWNPPKNVREVREDGRWSKGKESEKKEGGEFGGEVIHWLVEIETKRETGERGRKVVDGLIEILAERELGDIRR